MSAVLSSLEGRVAVITGGGRGQGRAHAVGLAADGADIVICDIDGQISTVGYPLSTLDDLEETARLVRETGRRCLVQQCDVRDAAAVRSVVDLAVEHFGRVDIAIANAGIAAYGLVEDLTDTEWHDVLDVNLTGVFNLIRAVIPPMSSQRHGRIVATASMAARGGTPTISHYVAAKWGVIGLVKSVALEVADRGITANIVCPANVNTMMIQNDDSYRLRRPDLEHPTVEDAIDTFTAFHAMPIPWVEPEDVTRVVRFLVDDGSSFISGSTLDVACGNTARIP